MNDTLLGKRRRFIADDRAICRLLISIYPRVKYPVALGVIGVKVVVALKIVYHNEVGCRKAPDLAFPWTIKIGIIYLINSPVVGLVPLQRSFRGNVADVLKRLSASIDFRRCCVGVSYSSFVIAEVHIVMGGFGTSFPTQRSSLFDIDSSVRRIRRRGPQVHIRFQVAALDHFDVPDAGALPGHFTVITIISLLPQGLDVVTFACFKGDGRG
ncbi:hypothetical protein ES703_95471 [subsurface metagenome]